jgi:hypothetical protein
MTMRIRVTKPGLRFERVELRPGSEHGVPDWFGERAIRMEKAERMESLPSDELPADIPGRKELVAAGLTTLDAVRAVNDFDEIKGIGQATEAKILAYLNTPSEGVSDG